MPPPRLELNDLNEVIRQSAQLYDGRLVGIEMRLLLEPELPSAMLDVEQIKRVFVNLIDNALEALADVDGEPRITITTRHDAVRELLVATLEDTGEGIPGGDFKRLFQPYFSTRGRGTGLGLPIVSRIISEHDGKVYAEANSPRGARFVIELPVTGA
jgi:signal transduction histidine kinase